MSRDYGMPSTRGQNDTEREAMRTMMANAHASYTENAGDNRGSVDVVVNFDTSVFPGQRYERGSRRCEMEGVVFDSCFARFRAEGRYGEMRMTFNENFENGYMCRDTY